MGPNRHRPRSFFTASSSIPEASALDGGRSRGRLHVAGGSPPAAPVRRSIGRRHFVIPCVSVLAIAAVCALLLPGAAASPRPVAAVATASPAGSAGAAGPAGAAGSQRSPLPAARHVESDPPRPVATDPRRLAGYIWPLANGRVTLPFGPTDWGTWLVDGKLFHDGVDIATFCGDHVAAAHSGTVLAAGRHFDDFMGWVGDLKPYYDRLDARHAWNDLPITVVVDDGNGYRSMYAHLAEVVVKPGDTVAAGDLLGYEGDTGHATGCHLHYGLFSPLDSNSFQLDPKIALHMELPAYETARTNPLLVLPFRWDVDEMAPYRTPPPGATPPPSPSPSPSPSATR